MTEKIKLWRPKNFYDSLLPNYIMRAIFGCAVIYYPLHKPRIRLTVIYCLFIVSISWWCFYRVFMKRTAPDWYERDSGIFIAIMIYLNIQMGLTVLRTLFRDQHEQKVLLALSSIEDTLHRLGIVADFSQIFMIQLGFIILWAIQALGINILAAMWKHEKFPSFQTALEESVVLHAFHVNTFLEYSYFMSIRYIGRRYREINEYLTNLNMTNDHNQSMRKHGVRKKTGIFTLEIASTEQINTKCVVRILKQVHLHLRKSTREQTKIYSMQITILMSSSSLLITGLLYMLYSTMLRPSLSSSFKLERGIIIVISVFLTGLKVFLVNQTCASTTGEYERTRVILQKFGAMCNDPELQQDIKQFSFQIIANSLTFEPYGLVRLGYQYMLNYAATVTTNFILFIQNLELKDTSSAMITAMSILSLQHANYFKRTFIK